MHCKSSAPLRVFLLLLQKRSLMTNVHANVRVEAARMRNGGTHAVDMERITVKYSFRTFGAFCQAAANQCRSHLSHVRAGGRRVCM